MITLQRRRVSIVFLVAVVSACTGSPAPTAPSPAVSLSRPLTAVTWSELAASTSSAPMVVAADSPGAPSNLVSSVNGTTVTLTWSAAPGVVTTYVIEAGTGPGLSNVTSLPTGSNATTITVTGAPAGTFYVRVRARNAEGTSGASNEVTVPVGTTCGSAPNAPTGLSSSLTGAVLSLTWQASAGGCVDSYIVEAGITPNGLELANLDTGSPNTVLVVNVPGATPTTFYVRVRARNAQGRSAASNTATVTRGTTPPPPPPPPAGPTCHSCYVNFDNEKAACEAEFARTGSAGRFADCSNAALRNFYACLEGPPRCTGLP